MSGSKRARIGRIDLFLINDQGAGFCGPPDHRQNKKPSRAVRDHPTWSWLACSKRGCCSVNYIDELSFFRSRVLLPREGKGLRRPMRH